MRSGHVTEPDSPRKPRSGRLAVVFFAGACFAAGGVLHYVTGRPQFHGGSLSFYLSSALLLLAAIICVWGIARGRGPGERRSSDIPVLAAAVAVPAFFLVYDPLMNFSVSMRDGAIGVCGLALGMLLGAELFRRRFRLSAAGLLLFWTCMCWLLWGNILFIFALTAD